MGADFDPNTGAGAGLRTLYGSLGRGGYEGIHPDDWGNVLIVEDVGGTTVMNNGRNPNSFVYRFVPLDPADLTHGKLQALQVSINGSPVVFVPVDTTTQTATRGRRTSCCSIQSATPGRCNGSPSMTRR